MYEFHVSRAARDLYRFDETIYALTGNVLIQNPRAAREFADKMNRVRNVPAHPDRAVKASDIDAMGLIDEVLHYMIGLYRSQVNPNLLNDSYEYARQKGLDVENTLIEFLRQFPPRDVYRGLLREEEYYAQDSTGQPNRLTTLEEMLLLYITNSNPAVERYLELFDDSILEERTHYPHVIASLDELFRTMPPFGPYGQTLLDLLMSPIRAAPHSLYGQLEYIRTHWGHLLGGLYARLLVTLDFIKEETKPRFFGKGEAPVPVFTQRDYEDMERFSPDLDWMPSLVLMAKSVYVWLYQLSRKYGRHIWRLDQIPDEELDTLAAWGFTGLWLIGIWERSPASRTIKRLTGNPEAESSAYSIFEYKIASDLGGDEAFENLKARAFARGIRMATDMVPNHMGIYSRWVLEHPDWFIQLDYPPFPSYRFTGVNLSQDERYEIQIEDGYWNRTDAAVVFRWHDRHTGRTRYIYHGNDGTSMPWNDTAQLDFLKEEVRRSVIDQTIAIARRFPIIRFDAAMTLAKRHFQRLWYPVPGYGGDIPSRSGHSVPPEEFERLFPVEFWRELVDRVAQEAPDTLLLAEAFWLMEGYFVRSLGMHRVYNSAFMNMLKAEENSKYRDVMKNVLRFNPEILRRFVNFMNNPDEEPAAVCFGKGDKYFGVATLMATMPGLPMFGHGQVEGFAEKYGMEYRRSYWDEPVDGDLLGRHEREIFPLLKRRRLFSGVENFVLYDCRMHDGHVNEDVFAYSNRLGDERVLVIYNNRFSEASGTLSRSVGMNVGDASRRSIVQKSLSEGLGLKADEDLFYIFRDEKSGLEYVRNGADLARNGLRIHLGAYKCHVFTSFREVRDVEARWKRVEQRLAGAGHPDVWALYREISVEKVLVPFRTLIAPEDLRALVKEGRALGTVPPSFSSSLRSFFETACAFAQIEGEAVPSADRACLLLDALFTVDRLRHKRLALRDERVRSFFSMLEPTPREDLEGWRIPLLWSVMVPVAALSQAAPARDNPSSYIDEWMLGVGAQRAMESLGAEASAARREAAVVTVLAKHHELMVPGRVSFMLREMLLDADVRDLLGVNHFGGTWWFNREAMNEFLGWASLCTALVALAGGSFDDRKALEIVCEVCEGFDELSFKVDESRYEIERLASLREAAA